MAIQRLRSIAQSGIGQYVRRLTLGLELLPKGPPSPESYLVCLYHQHCYENRNENPRPPAPHPGLSFGNIGHHTGRTEWTEECMVAAYGSYRQMIEDQKLVEVTGMDVVCLAASLSRLDNLRSIAIQSDNFNQDRSQADFSRDISILHKKALLMPFYARHIRQRDHGARHLRNIIRATAVAGAKITELALSDSDNTMATRILSLRPEDLIIAVVAFRNVKKFYFKLPDFTASELDVDIFAAGQLARFVQAMGCLEELTLVSSSCNPYVPWEASFDFHEQEFMEFLLRHRTTLRVVKLFCVEMYSGTFTSLLCGMREGLSLVSLELTGILEDADGSFLEYSYTAAKALEDYVTMRRQDFPVEILRRHQRGSSEEVE
ncbi:hypothetical protein IFR05_007110 [Cadophora sp. M221]|nr:hypothetical protein IFR05_007110 [Cadophora sp. M221]